MDTPWPEPDNRDSYRSKTSGISDAFDPRVSVLSDEFLDVSIRDIKKVLHMQ